MLLLLALVVGHGVDEPPAGHTLVEEAGGDIRGAWTSYGLLQRDQDSWRWTPEEAVPADFVWDASFDQDAFVVATSTGIFASTDGCDWQQQSGHSVRALARLQGSMFAAVENARGPGGVLKRSSSGGGPPAWQPHSLWQDDLQMTGLLSDKQTLWATGFDGRMHRLWRSDGRAWTAVRATLSSLRLLGTTRNAVWVATATGAVELSEQGAALREVAGDWQAVAQDAAAVVLLGSDGHVFEVHTDGSITDTRRTAERLSRGWLGVDRTQAEHHFESIGGDGLVHFDRVLAQNCPADSAAGRVSDDIWPLLQAQGVGPQTEPEPDSGGCRSTSDGGWSWLLCLLAWALIRRR